VELAQSDGVHLTIQDDGVGIPSEEQRGLGSGLRIMAYRARVIEGQLTVTLGEGGGTVVRCVLPHGAGRS
jgi:signal transduction histidine kinase